MRRLVLVFSFLICLPFSVNAEEKSIELTGERLTYHGDGEEIIAINGKLIYQDVVLEGQKIHIFLQKKQLEAFGDVVVTENKEQFHASQANFNWDTDSWEFFDASSEFTGRSIVGKVFFRGKNLTREPDLTTVDESFMTSCDLEKPHYHIDAQKIEIIPDKRVILHGISYWDFGFKIFTLPYYVIFLDRKEQLPFIPIIGQSSSYGFYVNLFFNYFVNYDSYGTVYLDWYQKDGWGIGVRHYIEHQDPYEKGQLYLYYRDPSESQSTLKANLQYQKKLDQYTDLTFNTDYNLLLDDQKDTISSQLAILHKKGRSTTRLNLTYNSNASNENSNLASYLNYTYDFGDKLIGTLILDYKRLSQWGNYIDEDLKYQASFQKSSGSMVYALRYDGHADPEGDLFTGDPGRYFFKIPEFEVAGSRTRIGKSDFYYKTSFVGGHYFEEETNVRDERYRFQLQLDGTNQIGENTTLKPSINFIQDFYGNGFARYIWEGNISLTQLVSDQGKVSLNYNRSGYDGATPFKTDYTTRETNYASLSASYKSNYWEIGIEAGYDFMNQDFTDTIFSLKYHENDEHSIALKGSYDFDTGDWLGLAVDTTWRINKDWRLSVDGTWNLTNGDLQGLEVGVTRDLHCREITFFYDKPRDTFWLEYTIKAFPSQKVTLGG